jgi:hypothetical protein
MAGLNHEFLLLSREQYPYAEYMQWINNPKAIHLHDDLMHYLDDSLRWITCYNPAKRMLRHKGLNFYGPTVIKSDGAVVLQRVLEGVPIVAVTAYPMSYSRVKAFAKGCNEYMAKPIDMSELANLVNRYLRVE